MAQTQLVLGMFETYMKVIPDLVDLFGDVLKNVEGNPGARYAPENKDGIDKFQAALKRELNGNFSAKVSRLFGRKNVIFPSEINPQMLIDDTLDLITKEDGSSGAGALTEGLQDLMRSVQSLKKGERIEMAPEVSSGGQVQVVNQIPTDSKKEVAQQSQPTAQAQVPFAPATDKPAQVEDYVKKTMEEFNALGLSENDKANSLSELVDDLNNGKDPKEAFASFLDIAKSISRMKKVPLPLSYDDDGGRKAVVPPSPSSPPVPPRISSVPPQS
jgi:hypothetical protein